MTLALVAAGALGCVVGSFLNVVVHRLPREESVVRPRSRCPSCLVPIRPWHNVPVIGWLALRGRCASCHRPISPRYPLIELGTALLFAAVTWRVGVTTALPAYLYLAAIAIALAAIDLDVRRLPDAIVLPSYLVGGGLLLAASVAGAEWGRGGRGLLAMLASLAFYFALAFVHPGGMGFGDVKLAGLLGLYLGWLGWNSVIIGTFAGFALGGVVGVALLVTGRAGRKTAIPFGPYMLAGAMVALFWATPVTDWYLSMLRPAS